MEYGNMEPVKSSPRSGKSSEDDDGGAAAPPPPPSNEAAACFLCGRTFASRKAMYGHMRCHPESERRRGALQATSPAAGNPCTQVDSTSSLASSLWALSKTAKRGGKGMVASSDPAQSPDLEDSPAAMEDGPQVFDNSASGGTLRAPEIRTAVLPLDGEDGKREAASEPNSEESATATSAGSEDTESNQHCVQKDGGLGAQACGCHCCKRRCSSSSQKKRMRAGDTEAAETASRGNACSAYGKSFPSFQAFGDNMARHGNLSVKDPAMGSGDGAGSAGAAGSSVSTQRKRPEVIPVEHRCNICGKVYQSGQALGGHKRLHWEGLKRPAPPVGAAAPSQRDLQEGASPRVRDFDLNQPPRQEDGEGRSGWL